MSNSPSNPTAISMAVTAGHAVCVSLAGDIDLASEPDLDCLASNLAATSCTVVYIDLSGVTLASSSLINFLFRLAAGVPSHTTVSVCRPDAMTSRLFEATGVHGVMAVRADLPADWAASWATASIAVPGQAVIMA